MVKSGFTVGIITGGSSATIEKRFQPLGVKDIYLKSFYKLPNFDDYYTMLFLPAVCGRTITLRFFFPQHVCISGILRIFAKETNKNTIWRQKH
jgi:hypothetical protein